MFSGALGRFGVTKLCLKPNFCTVLSLSSEPQPSGWHLQLLQSCPKGLHRLDFHALNCSSRQIHQRRNAASRKSRGVGVPTSNLHSLRLKLSQMGKCVSPWFEGHLQDSHTLHGHHIQPIYLPYLRRFCAERQAILSCLSFLNMHNSAAMTSSKGTYQEEQLHKSRTISR